jgi:hypothetical protein
MGTWIVEFAIFSVKVYSGIRKNWRTYIFPSEFDATIHFGWTFLVCFYHSRVGLRLKLWDCMTHDGHVDCIPDDGRNNMELCSFYFCPSQIPHRMPSKQILVIVLRHLQHELLKRPIVYSSSYSNINCFESSRFDKLRCYKVMISASNRWIREAWHRHKGIVKNTHIIAPFLCLIMSRQSTWPDSIPSVYQQTEIATPLQSTLPFIICRWLSIERPVHS